MRIGVAPVGDVVAVAVQVRVLAERVGVGSVGGAVSVAVLLRCRRRSALSGRGDNLGRGRRGLHVVRVGVIGIRDAVAVGVDGVLPVGEVVDVVRVAIPIDVL